MITPTDTPIAPAGPETMEATITAEQMQKIFMFHLFGWFVYAQIVAPRFQGVKPQ